MNLVKQWLVNWKLRVQWGSNYPSATQVESYVAVLRGSGQLSVTHPTERASSAQGHFKAGKSRWEAVPGTGGNLQCWDNTRPSRADQNTADRSVPQTTGEADQTRRFGQVCCTPHWTSLFGTRPFLRWVQTQDRNPIASGIVKNTFGPVGSRE